MIFPVLYKYCPFCRAGLTRTQAMDHACGGKRRHFGVVSAIRALVEKTCPFCKDTRPHTCSEGENYPADGCPHDECLDGKCTGCGREAEDE